jgi:hypothetical protein
MVGLPLLCNIAASAVTSGIPDANVAAVAGQITLACAEASTQGVSGIDAVSKRLSALAVANPAVDPVIAQLAKIIGAAGTGSPVEQFFRQVEALILFFK